MSAGRFLAVIALIGATMIAAPTAAQAAPGAPCLAPVDVIACENSKPGTPRNQWYINGDGDPSIQGFATSMSVNKGSSISFKIKSATPDYRIDIYRIGYYGGQGARLIASNVPRTHAVQPACVTSSASGLVDCGNWSVSSTWSVPITAVSGVYIARLERTDTETASQIVFVVRDDASTSGIVVQTSDQTWQAYNPYGGNSLYSCTVACPPGEPLGYKAAYKVSYNRPMISAGVDGGKSWLFTGAEYPMIRFLEASGYDVSYISGVDAHARGALLRNHKLFISSGHDEYWSGEQRSNATAARDAGVNLAFFSGNEMFWKTRFEPSIAGPSMPDRTLVSYKDTHFAQQEDPVEWTGTWRDPRYGSFPDAGNPENALIGQFFLVNSGTTDIVVPAAYKNLRMWRNTAVASLAAGGSVRLAYQTLGYEWDVDIDNGFRPPGQFRLSSTTVAGVEVFLDYGSTVGAGTATHNLTMYRAPSGALVFGAGTVQWAFGLDDFNPSSSPADRNQQQATVNLFADMGVQPYQLLPGLVAASKSTDTTRPVSSITSPTGSVASGNAVTISGAASDIGGVVAGVEVSTDGGTTWHPANGTTNWSYTWIASGEGSTTLKSRAVDDSGNLETPGVGLSVNVTCPCSLWGNVTPPFPDSGDANAVEVGMKFRSDKFGTITGVRFYKSAANTGTHVGSLWTASGQRLAQAVFTSETSTGWQKATFATPVQIMPDTTYVASYFAPNGHYAASANALHPNPPPTVETTIGNPDSSPLHALRNRGSTTNGVFAYTPASTFPTNSFLATNYWVDVLFTTSPTPGQVTNVAATADNGGAQVSWTAPTTGGPVTSYTVTPFVGLTAQTSKAKTVNGSPPSTSTVVSGLTPGVSYTFRVQASNPNGGGPQSEPSNAVVPLELTAPQAPTEVTAEPAAETKVHVRWKPPDRDGGQPITSYTITPYAGSVAQPTTTAGASATSATITGLETATAYTFKVSATNSIGTGPQSQASDAAAPYAMIFESTAPKVTDSGDASGFELGVKIRSDVPGFVHGVRFYKSAANTGTHVGSLWTTSGQRLAHATFTSESTSGWQNVVFSTAVPIEANTTYIASYHAPNGHYAFDKNAFATSGVDNGPLHAVANGTSPNGVHAFGGPGTFPSGTFEATNYWVDVLFARLRPPGEATNVTATADQASAKVSWTAPAGGGATTTYKITPYIGATAQTATTITGTPPATSTTVRNLTPGTSYTFRVQASNAAGSGPQSAASNPVTPTPASAPGAPTAVSADPASRSALVRWTPPASDGGQDITSYRITPYVGSTEQTPVTVGGSAKSTTVSGLTNGTTYTFKVEATNSVGTGAQSAASDPVSVHGMLFDLKVPATPDAGDGNAVELGVKFRATLDGWINGVRFYKSAANTGTHIGSLWTTSGQRLAQATFTGESSSGWQSVRFASPVPVTANTVYVASYHAPNGRYAFQQQAFAIDPVDNGPLRALATTTSPNGVYAYGGASSFPTGTYNATNYWVDVLYTELLAPGQVTGVTATADNGAARVSWSAPSSGGQPSSYEITPYIGSTAQTTKTITGSPPATTTMVSGLTPGTTYTFRVRAVNSTGAGPVSSPSNSVVPLASGAPGAPTDVTAEAGVRAATVSWTAPEADGGQPITGYTITPYVESVAQTPTSVDASARSKTVTGLSSGTTYTFKVSASNAAATGPQSAASNPVTTPFHTIFGLGTPAVVDSGDGSSIELGVKFRSDVAGTINGIRFFKAAANTGTHVGSLWTSSGQRMAQATFTSETGSGWQSVTFDTPVAIAANTTYVASYHTTTGRYSYSGGAFNLAFDSVPLRVPSDATSGGNGVYVYSATSAYPSNSFNATNYWVDVLFAGPGP